MVLRRLASGLEWAAYAAANNVRRRAPQQVIRRRAPGAAARFSLIAAVSAIATYATFVAGADSLTYRWRLILAVGSAVVLGSLTALQVVSSFAAAPPSPANSPTAPQRALMQLPRDLRDFTGRSLETRWLVSALASERRSASAVVISAISGQGGVGKTALALHAAHLVAERFPHGQIYVNLRGPEAEALDPFDVLGGLLRDLGVAPSAIPRGLEERARMFRSILARMHMLIVLDNALEESQVRPLLPGSSSSVVLITSRAALTGLEGIRTLRLDVMDESEALQFLAEVIGADRVAREPSAAQELVELCAHLPLAVRIVGSRMVANPHWTLDGLVRRLRGQHRLLDDLQDGERAIRATLDISFVGLDPRASSVFCRLGALTIRTFPGWLFPVLGDTEDGAAMSGLDALLRVDMIGALGVDRFGVNRYGFHDLLREYSRERLERLPDGDRLFRETVAAAGRAFYSNVVTADALLRTLGNRYDLHPTAVAHAEVTTPLVQIRSRADALDWLDSELANVLLVLEQQVDCGLHREAVMLAHSLSAYCEERSLWREWESAQRCALAAAEALGDQELVCHSSYVIGRIHHLLGDWDSASRELTIALTIAGARGLRNVEAASLCALGKIGQLGRLDQAISFFQRSREIYAELGHRHAWAYVTANIGDIYHQQGEWELSMREFDLCMPIFREVGDRWWEANAGIWIGDVLRGQGRMSDSLSRLRASLDVLRALGDERRAAVALVHIGRAYADFGHGRQAAKAIGAALPALEKAADRWWQAMAFVELGKAHALSRRRIEAVDCWRKSLPILEELGNERLLTDVRQRIEAASR